MTAQIYFTDFFGVDPVILEEYGAFDVSLVNDLPLFIDPFLLFNSEKTEYQKLHEEIIRYLRFLRDKALVGSSDSGQLKAWYYFKEVKQNWLGLSLVGNEGSGLGPDFGKALHDNLGSIFTDFGQEHVTRGSHLEKVCLVDEGVGRDNISDFTTSLIKGYLLEYTQAFAQTHLRSDQRRVFTVERARFSYETETWEVGRFELPTFNDDFVLLTPKDMLTRDDTWISRRDFLLGFDNLVAAVPDDQLRAQLNNYLRPSSLRTPSRLSRRRSARNDEPLRQQLSLTLKLSNTTFNRRKILAIEPVPPVRRRLKK